MTLHFTFLQLAGIAVAVCSFVLLLVSRVQLGKAFAVMPKAKFLVTRGIYAKLRNPMYVFVDLTLVGIAMATRWWVAAIPAVLAITQTIQAKREAKVLEGAFGDQYREYVRQTWF
jgi:protein-S-isoprenylcysteine O-methyltransferase Ste14